MIVYDVFYTNLFPYVDISRSISAPDHNNIKMLEFVITKRK